jgi:predicted RNase H-like HicB family nuclease
MRVFYPVIFRPEPLAGGYSVSAPDLDGCFSQGDTLEEACVYIKEAIGLWLEGEEYPIPSDPRDIRCEADDFVVMVEFDMSEYKKRAAKTIKKTLSLPVWLNDEAERRHVNFSGVLQEALKQRLGI